MFDTTIRENKNRLPVTTDWQECCKKGSSRNKESTADSVPPITIAHPFMNGSEAPFSKSCCTHSQPPTLDAIPAKRTSSAFPSWAISSRLPAGTKQKRRLIAPNIRPHHCLKVSLFAKKRKEQRALMKGVAENIKFALTLVMYCKAQNSQVKGRKIWIAPVRKSMKGDTLAREDFR